MSAVNRTFWDGFLSPSPAGGSCPYFRSVTTLHWVGDTYFDCCVFYLKLGDLFTFWVSLL